MKVTIIPIVIGTFGTVNNNNNNQKTEKMEEKQLSGRLKPLTSNISYEKAWTWLRKGKVKIQTKYLLIGTQNKTFISTLSKHDEIWRNKTTDARVVIETKQSIAL